MALNVKAKSSHFQTMVNKAKECLRRGHSFEGER